MRPAAGACGPCHRPKIVYGRSATGELVSGGNGEGAGRAASYMEAYKSARGVHKLFTCNSRCSDTPSASGACSFPVIYRTREYSACEALTDCGSRSCGVAGSRAKVTVIRLAEPRERSSNACVTAARRSLPSAGGSTLRLDCSPAKLRLQADATGSHRIVFGCALLLGDATRTSVATWSRPTHVTDTCARKSLDCPCAYRGSFLWLRHFQHYTRAIARTSRGKRSSMVTRRWVTPWSWA
jgi:hypothetical protein